MAIKHFCDECGNELNKSNSVADGISGQGRKFRFYIEVGTIGLALGSGDWCKYCVIDAINELDDRPKQAVAA